MKVENNTEYQIFSPVLRLRWESCENVGSVENGSSSLKDFPPFSDGDFLGSLLFVSPGETAYADFPDFHDGEGGEAFCYMVSGSARVPTGKAP